MASCSICRREQNGWLPIRGGRTPSASSRRAAAGSLLCTGAWAAETRSTSSPSSSSSALATAGQIAATRCFWRDCKWPIERHPITRGLAPLTIRDEFYYRLKTPSGEPAPRTLVTATIDGHEEMVSWAWERPDGGRSFGFSGLHFHDNWREPSYRRLVTQGVLWTVKLDLPEGGANVEVEEDALKLK